MAEGFSPKEVAAIAGLPESVVRTAIEKKVIVPRTRPAGRAVRYALDVKDVFYVKLLADFPLDLDRADKRALRDLVFRRTRQDAGRWRAEGSDFVLTSGSLVIHVEVGPLRDKLARDLDTYRRGRRRLISDPAILGGEPVFAGTRIPLAHIALMIANGVDRTEILEDYPALCARDLDYAAIHARMKADPGRPRKPIAVNRTLRRTTSGRAASDR